MKRIIFLSCLVAAAAMGAASTPITVHLSCGSSPHCLTFTEDKEEVRFVIEPAMEFNETNVKEASFERDRDDHEVVQFTLNDSAAKAFEQLTAKHIGEPIALAIGGKIVMAPRVKAAISGGRLLIESGRDKNLPNLRLPWLEKISAATREAAETKDHRTRLLYAALTLLVIGGSFTYVYWPQRTLSQSQNG